MLRQFELIEKVLTYDPHADEDLLNKAYVFAMKAHGSQKRASGDPYFLHPLEVSGILTEMKLDAASIATGLLHDTVEDTLATLEEIEKLFGLEIAKLVDGVTKLSKIELQSDQTKQAENFRKLVLAMSSDIRVLLVKLADRLHNMRTLHYIQFPEKRQRIARETVEIYAPLAERIGMQDLRDELEDLSFLELHSESRSTILEQLEKYRAQEKGLVTEIIEKLHLVLEKGGVPAAVSGREKTPYSIWKKMQSKNVAFDQLSDIMAFRIVVKTIAECYQALGIIHSSYLVVPGRFKDYISTPKPNGYRSLHTTVIGPHSRRIEVQIRTQEMHEISELGVAAHWQYKEGTASAREGHQYRWLRGLLEILGTDSGAEEFLENTKLEMFQDEVFCFTPNGELIVLPQKATPVDFAYAVHSELGDRCIGSKVNGRLVPLRTQLENGDQVEIISGKKISLSPAWERFVVTGKARARIRKFIRSQHQEQYQALGKDLLHKALRKANLECSEKKLESLLPHLRAKTLEALYVEIGEGHLPIREILNHLQVKALHPAVSEEETYSLKSIGTHKENETSVSLQGLIPGMAIHYAGCCHPLPGEKIVGIITTGSGVTIHTSDCENLENFKDEPERWVDVSWGTPQEQERHLARIKVTLVNSQGSLGTLTTLIGKSSANIVNLKIIHRSQDLFELLLDLEVKNVEHLKTLMASLRTSSLIHQIERI